LLAADHARHQASGELGVDLVHDAGEVRAIRGETVLRDARDGGVVVDVAATVICVEAGEGALFDCGHVGVGTLDSGAGGGLSCDLKPIARTLHVCAASAVLDVARGGGPSSGRGGGTGARLAVQARCTVIGGYASLCCRLSVVGRAHGVEASVTRVALGVVGAGSTNRSKSDAYGGGAERSNDALVRGNASSSNGRASALPVNTGGRN